MLVVWIKQWAQGIIIAVIIATILEMLLPDNNNKKYINTIIGIYILFSIISPIISKLTGNSINIEKYVNDTTSIATNYTIKNVELLENNSSVEDMYIKTLKDNITNELKKYGFYVEKIELQINTKSEKNYGEILGIYLTITNLDKKEIVTNIKEIKINTSGNTTSEKSKSSISEGEKNKIKEILMNVYGIEKNKIYIN